MATGYEITIQLPPNEPRPRGLLVDVASKITPDSFTVQGRDRIGLGVQHIPWGCDPLWLGNAEVCAEDVLFDADGTELDTNKDDALIGYPDPQTHPAFKLVDGIACSVMSFPDSTFNNASMVNRLRNRMRTLVSFFLAKELATGTASGGPSLSDGTDLGSVGSVGEAAVLFETFLGDQLFGSQGIIHMSPAVLHAAVEIGWVQIESGGLLTASGHKVSADAGYGGPIGDDANTFMMYASGPIFYRVSDTKLLGENSETLDLYHNIRQRLAEAFGQLAFDACPVAKLAVESPALTVILGS